MAARKADPDDIAPRRPPATTPEARENQIIGLAYNEAERQIRNKEASSQIITYFLKAGAAREQLEKEKLKHENLLLAARADQLATGQNIEELYAQAVLALTDYKGENED